MLVLNEIGVEVFIKRFDSKNSKSFWDNYDLVIWDKNSSGYMSPGGMFKNNAWGMAQKVSINNDGLWKLNKKYVKYFR
jgi:hypothetical protein